MPGQDESSSAAYHPPAYWESRADELIRIYDEPETWVARSWMKPGVEERRVPRLLRRAGVESVLVIGAGSGRQYGYLREAGLRVTGVEIAPTLAAECRSRYPDVPTAEGDFIDLAPELEPADCVLSSAVMQHVPPARVEAAATAVQSLARRAVILRECTHLTIEYSYIWAHDYPGLFGDWPKLYDRVTDRNETSVARLMCFGAPGAVRPARGPLRRRWRSGRT